MKVEKKQKEFSPIVVTIENRNEFDAIVSALNEFRPYGGFADPFSSVQPIHQALAAQLRSAL